MTGAPNYPPERKRPITARASVGVGARGRHRTDHGLSDVAARHPSGSQRTVADRPLVRSALRAAVGTRSTLRPYITGSRCCAPHQRAALQPDRMGHYEPAAGAHHDHGDRRSLCFLVAEVGAATLGPNNQRYRRREPGCGRRVQIQPAEGGTCTARAVDSPDRTDQLQACSGQARRADRSCEPVQYDVRSGRRGRSRRAGRSNSSIPNERVRYRRFRKTSSASSVSTSTRPRPPCSRLPSGPRPSFRGTRCVLLDRVHLASSGLDMHGEFSVLHDSKRRTRSIGVAEQHRRDVFVHPQIERTHHQPRHEFPIIIVRIGVGSAERLAPLSEPLRGGDRKQLLHEIRVRDLNKPHPRRSAACLPPRPSRRSPNRSARGARSTGTPPRLPRDIPRGTREPRSLRVDSSLHSLLLHCIHFPASTTRHHHAAILILAQSGAGSWRDCTWSGRR